MKNTGGPAFPAFETREVYDDYDGRYREVVEPHGGMTLRDYFAAKAMQADLEYQGLEGRQDIPNVAAMAYYMADAMLVEREK